MVAEAFYRLLQRIGETSAHATPGISASWPARAVRRAHDLREVHRYIRGMVGWLGFRSGVVRYRRRPPRRRRDKYPLIRMVRPAVSAIVSFSTLSTALVLLGGYPHRDTFASTSRSPSCSGTRTTFRCRVADGTPGVDHHLRLPHPHLPRDHGEYVGRDLRAVENRPLFLIRERLNLGDGDARTGSPG